MSAPSPPSSYDDIPYPSVPFVQSHPDRLATVARLFGMDPPPAPVECCRVLELGCGRGDNLIPLALGLPRAGFVGIDLSAGEIAAGRAAVKDLRVGNVDLHHMDVLDFPKEMGHFDYVIAHGIYSWVPCPVRDGILDVCRRHLAPAGVAYVSYNTLPGWRAGSVVRDALRFDCRQTNDRRAAIERARTMLDFLCGAIPDELGPYRSAFTDARRRLSSTMAADPFLYHEYLEEVNEPVYFHEFAGHAERHGLQFLAEADVPGMQISRFPPHVAEALATRSSSPSSATPSRNVIEREQYIDFLKNTSFRRTLLCHQEVSVQRELSPQRLVGLHVASTIRLDEAHVDLHTSAPLSFEVGNGVTGSTDHPLTKAALLHLHGIWPAAVPLETLLASARTRLLGARAVLVRGDASARDEQELADNLLKLFAAGAIELHAHPVRFAAQVNGQPAASPWARRQAAAGTRVTNLRHDRLEISELGRRLLLLMDGTRNRAQLLEALVQHVAEDGVVVYEEGRPVRDPARLRGVLGERMDEDLRLFAKAALLTD